ncbi:ABC transporter substrate-binding protein [Paenibacillus beijingensis]|uniref:ABC transporter substrate-binding protein n=1 Tax=Paenibacillus beijingensis TaxID=1126833 RepID=A0A0D5NM44_9BACL|nr:extracellular solute-binding protein [Paenibacillus beijingensis]AJY76399.1 ABC transporter substrate-binding protein [Paenibacillus beijingensis]
MVNRIFSTFLTRRTAAAGLALVMAGTLLSACSGSGNSTAERHVLRIGMVYGSDDSESYFRQQFTDTFEYTHPNIDLEIVSAVNYNDQMFNQPSDGTPAKQPDPYEKLKELLTGTNPVDVIVFDYNLLQRMTRDNLLKQLDPLIAQDKFDLSDYVPTVIDGIKDAGDNNIYALTPTFSGSALFYNKKIFQDAGVTPPTDGMQWPEVFNLARQMTKGSGENKIFGFAFNRWSSDGYSDTQQYAAPLQLKMYDDKGETMLVDTPKWNNVWTTIAGLYKDKIVPGFEDVNKINESLQKAMGGTNGNYYNPFQGDLFITGHQAMVIADYGYINQLKLAKDNSSKIKGFTVPDWDVVTVPTHSEAPGIGMSSYLGQLMGINSKALNSDDAWEFIKFLNSKEWAKLKSRSMYEIPARKEFIKPIDGMTYNIQAFYSLKPIPPASMELENIGREKPGIYQIYSIGSELFQQVVQGNKTVDQALKEFSTRGNTLLQKLKTNPNGDMGGPAEGGGVSTEATEATKG